MKRNMDLVRTILMVYEDTPKDSNVWLMNKTPEIPGYHKEEIECHEMMMRDAGLLKPNLFTLPNGIEEFLGVRMTWAGHDFLEASRDEKRWAKAKEIFKKVGGATFDIMLQILTKMMKDQVDQILH